MLSAIGGLSQSQPLPFQHCFSPLQALPPAQVPWMCLAQSPEPGPGLPHPALKCPLFSCSATLHSRALCYPISFSLDSHTTPRGRDHSSSEQCSTYCYTLSLGPSLPCVIHDFCEGVSLTSVCFVSTHPLAPPSRCLHGGHHYDAHVAFLCLATLCPWRSAGVAWCPHSGISRFQWQCLRTLPFQSSPSSPPHGRKNQLSSVSFPPAIPPTPRFWHPWYLEGKSVWVIFFFLTFTCH